MALLAGGALDPKRFFREGSVPLPQGSSFDLTIGSIFDTNGQRITGPYTLKPGHMVQVASAQAFNLPANVTGHVTYKTTLTSKGIWALTVGIVDPGWNGPISTTLLNFSRIDHLVSEGDAFLRVSFFEHAAVSSDRLRKAPPVEDYLRTVQRAAASVFPKTFLDHENIARQAGDTALSHMRSQALTWVGAIALLFALIQIMASYLHPSYLLAPSPVSKEEFYRLQGEVDTMRGHLRELQQTAAQFREKGAPSVEVPPPATQPNAPQTEPPGNKSPVQENRPPTTDTAK